MKKMLTLFYTAAFIFSTIFAQTTLSIQLDDSYGDGWDTAVLSIAGSDYTVTDGYTATYSVDLDDGTYSWSYTEGSWPGENSWVVSTTDGVLFSGNGSTGPFSGTFTLGGNITSIYDVQFSDDAENDYPSPLDGQTVTVSGVVTAVRYNGVNIQDSNELWSGIWVYDGGGALSDANIGDIVMVTGEVEEYNLLTEIILDAGEIIGAGGSVDIIEIMDLEDVHNEAHEGMLVHVMGVCTDADVSDYGQWDISDDSGTVQIEDTFVDYEPILGAHYEMVGVVGQSSYDADGMYEVAPIDSMYIIETEPCNDNQLFVEMFDSWGDGWNGNFLAIGTDTLWGPEASYADAGLCLADGTYPVVCDGGSYQSEVSWVIYDVDGTELLAGGAPFQDVLQLGESNDVLGCTDESAVNYDGQATVDDGSCYYDGDSCSVALAAVAGENAAAGPAWYSYTTTMDGFLTISSQNETGDAEWDTDLYVYGSCDAEAPLANNDDCCGYYGPSEVTMPITAGETYQIHWAASWSADPFVFHVLEAAPPTAPQNLTAEAGLESVYLMWEGVPLGGGDSDAYLTSIGSNLQNELDAYDAKKAETVLPMEPHGYAEVYIKGNRDTRNTNVTIVCDGGDWQSEVSWEILNEAGDLVADGGAPATVEAVLDDGFYTVNGYDAWGDGWNGNTLTVTGDDGTEYINFTIESGDFASGTFFIGEQTEFANLTLSDMYYDYESDVVAVTVTNDGTFNAGGFYVTYYLTFPTSGECANPDYDGYSFVDGLAVGESTEIGIGPGILAYMGGYGTYEMGAMVDYLCEIEESNEDDNTITENIELVDPFAGVTWTVWRSEAGGDLTEVGVSQSQEYLDEGLTGEVEYCYTVQQVNSEGATPSDTSNHACATPLAPVDVPTPTDLVGEADGWQVVLNWTAPDVGGGGTGGAEDFESGEFPGDWDMTTLATSCPDGYGVDWAGWIITQDGSSQYWSVPAGDGLYAVSNDDQCNQDGSQDYLHLPPMDMSGGGETALLFSSFLDGAYGQTGHILVSTDGGNTYDEAYLVGTANNWTDVSVDLNAYSGESDVRVVFHSNDNGVWASGWAIDNVQMGAPADYDLLSYNVYRGSAGNEELAASGVQDESFSEYQTEVGTYSYSVTAVYDIFGESAPSNYVDVEVSGAAPSCNAPRDLTATASGNDVSLAWSPPEGGAGWLGYGDGIFSSAIGTGGEASFAVAARFGPDQLIDYDGMSLTRVQFIPNEPSATYRVMVWTAATNGTPVAIDSSELLSGADLVMGDYNIVDLVAPISIDWTTELWFGYSVTTTAGYPAGTDAGPAVNGWGNKILWSGAWANLTDLNAALDFNWAIQGYVTFADGRSIALMPEIDESSFPQKVRTNEGELKHMGVILPPLNESNSSRELLNYQVYRDGELLSETAVDVTAYDDIDAPWGVHEYVVTAMYNNTDECGESEPSNTVYVDLFNNPPLGFSLISPGNGYEATVTPDNINEQLAFIWTPAADVDGDVVFYTLAAMSDDEVYYYDTTSSQTGIFVDYGSMSEDAANDGVSNIVYYWNVGAHDGSDTTLSNDGPRMLILDISGLLGVDDINTPDVFALHNNYPNPFNPITNITYDIPEVADVVLEIFNMSGQKVRTLINDQQEPGRYKIVWNATNDTGQSLASGMYVYRIKAGDFVSVKKLILMK